MTDGPRKLRTFDWDGKEVLRDPDEDAEQVTRWRRVRDEVAEMRTAVDRMRAGTDPLHRAVADFVDIQAHLLDSCNDYTSGVQLDPMDDTRAHPEYRASAVRSALLISRAFLAAGA